MVLLFVVFGLLLAIAGLTVFARHQKVIGTALFLAGSVFIVIGVVAVLSFRP